MFDWNVVLGCGCFEKRGHAPVSVGGVILAGNIKRRPETLVDIGISDSKIFGEFGIFAEMPRCGLMSCGFRGPLAIGIATFATDTTTNT